MLTTCRGSNNSNLLEANHSLEDVYNDPVLFETVKNGRDFHRIPLSYPWQLVQLDNNGEFDLFHGLEHSRFNVKKYHISDSYIIGFSDEKSKNKFKDFETDDAPYGWFKINLQSNEIKSYESFESATRDSKMATVPSNFIRVGE
jgi:hypothetical protein